MEQTMIRLHWHNATAEVVGPDHGITEEDLKGVDKAIVRAHRGVTELIAKGKLGYAKLPRPDEDAQVSDDLADIKKLVKEYRGSITDMIVLGIGGSALGNIALQAALNPATYNLLSDEERRRGNDGKPRPRLFVLDNVDPALVGDVLEFLGPRLATTLVNVISKSGETAETAAQLILFRERLGDGFAERIVATTDARTGTLHDIAVAEGYKMFVVPDDVGGRFSVLSPVGLFSAAMCGIKIDDLLDGAAAMKRRVETPLEKVPWRRNIACVLAAIKYLALTAKRKPMHVMMPYSNRLYSLADWYRQLWAESLGKKVRRTGEVVFTGATPIKALGTTDQHSQVQLYREGPNDKLIVFLEAEEHEDQDEIAVPPVPASQEPEQAEKKNPWQELAYLGGKKMVDLLNAEKRATEYALAFSRRPTVTIRFPEISAHTVGQFIYLYEFTTSLMGELLDIDAYNEPAVKLGKEATFALMERPGNVKPEVAADLDCPGLSYADLKKRIEEFAEQDDAHIA